MKKYITFFLLVGLFSSCGPEPMNDVFNEYTLKNISNHHVKIKVYYQTPKNSSSFQDTVAEYFIPENEEIQMSYVNRQVDSPFGLLNDSATIVFDNIRQIVYKRNDGHKRNILDVDNFVGGKVDDYLYQYVYEITNEDYENATEIK